MPNNTYESTFDSDGSRRKYVVCVWFVITIDEIIFGLYEVVALICNIFFTNKSIFVYIVL